MVCTGNICRSPMAEALLADRLGRAGVEARVHSVGLLSAGQRVPVHAVAALAPRGLDLGDHRSRRLSADHVAGADLVLGMTREHVREVVLLAPAAWARTFTLKELVRRAEAVGPRRPGQDLGGWLDAAHAGRTRRDLLGESTQDDVADPYGLGPADYEGTARELEGLVARLVGLAWGQAGAGTRTGQEHP
ncbi:MAG: hypothetical protein ACRDZW_02380 [Acidimicrobiales bacterium]